MKSAVDEQQVVEGTKGLEQANNIFQPGFLFVALMLTAAFYLVMHMPFWLLSPTAG